MLWAYRVAADIEQQERLDNPGSPIFESLRQLGGLPENGFPAPDRKLGVESMAVAWFHDGYRKDELGRTPTGASRLSCDRPCCRGVVTIDWRAAQPLILSAVRSVIGDRRENHLQSLPAKKRGSARLFRPSCGFFSPYGSSLIAGCSNSEPHSDSTITRTWKAPYRDPRPRRMGTRIGSAAPGALAMNSAPAEVHLWAALLVLNTEKLRFAHARR